MVKLTGRKLTLKPQFRKGPTRRKVPKKSMVNVIKKVLNNELETKYVAVQGQPQAMLGHINPPVDYHFMIPRVDQQTTVASSNVREGDKIKPIRASVQGHIWYDNLDVSTGNIIFVKLFFLLPKGLKNYNDFPGTLADGFLEAGTADPAQWTAANGALQAYYPICKENYTLMKTKTFKFTKNGGLPIGNAAGHDTNIGMDRVPFSFSWKPPVLKYAKDNDDLPSNYAPVMFAVAYSPGYNYDTDPNLAGQLQWSWQLSMSFKDA